MNLKALLFSIARWISLGAGVLFVVLSLRGGKSSASAQDVFSAAKAAMDVSGTEQAEPAAITRLYGIDPSSLDGCFLLFPSTNMGAKELFVAKLADSSDGEAILKAVGERLDSQKKSFDGYGAEQFALLTGSSRIVCERGFVIFTVCAEADAVIDAFKAAL